MFAFSYQKKHPRRFSFLHLLLLLPLLFLAAPFYDTFCSHITCLAFVFSSHLLSASLLPSFLNILTPLSVATLSSFTILCHQLSFSLPDFYLLFSYVQSFISVTFYFLSAAIVDYPEDIPGYSVHVHNTNRYNSFSTLLHAPQIYSATHRVHSAQLFPLVAHQNTS